MTEQTKPGAKPPEKTDGAPAAGGSTAQPPADKPKDPTEPGVAPKAGESGAAGKPLNDTGIAQASLADCIAQSKRSAAHAKAEREKFLAGSGDGGAKVVLEEAKAEAARIVAKANEEANVILANARAAAGGASPSS